MYRSACADNRLDETCSQTNTLKLMGHVSQIASRATTPSVAVRLNSSALLDVLSVVCRRVRVSAGPTGLGQMVLVVEDDGPGLPAEQRDAALQRGMRMDETTPGSGLGLSIVVELTRA